jgi:hypothetical protein
MNTRHTLHVIEVRTPCPADWEQMHGDEKSRFCQHCQKDVHNLSAMPADEAARLVCQSAGQLCVRFAKDESGKVLTLDYRGITKRRWSWKVWTLIALAGAMITASVQAVLFGKKITRTGPVMVLGGVGPPPPVVMGKPGPPVVMGEVAPPAQNPPAQSGQN